MTTRFKPVSIQDNRLNQDLNLTKILPLYEALFNSTTNTIASLFFIAIVAGTIEKTIASLYGLVDSLQWDYRQSTQKRQKWVNKHLRRFRW